MGRIERMRDMGLVALTILGTGGCSADARGGSQAIVVESRDSAGVRIVENRLNGPAPIYAELGAPDLEIGVVDGDPAYTFGRVAGVATLPGGAVVVADGQALEVRVFGPDGTHRHTFGTSGSGPGEFGSLTGIHVTGDTIWAFDTRNRRTSGFGPDGDLVAERTHPSRRYTRLHRFSDDSYLGVSGGLPPVAEGEQVVREAMELWYMGEGEDRQIDSLGGQEILIALRPTTTVAGELVFDMSMDTIEFGDADHLAAGPHGFWSGARSAFRLTYRAPGGERRNVVSAPDLERPLDAGEVDEERENALDGCDGSTGCVGVTERRFDADLMTERRPAFSALELDVVGRLWVADFDPSPDAVAGWHVFSATGELLGRVSTPPGLHVHEIGSDHVLGVVRNDLDVAFVRRYPLTRVR